STPCDEARREPIPLLSAKKIIPWISMSLERSRAAAIRREAGHASGSQAGAGGRNHYLVYATGDHRCCFEIHDPLHERAHLGPNRMVPPAIVGFGRVPNGGDHDRAAAA